MADIVGTNAAEILPLIPLGALGNDNISALGGNDIVIGYGGDDVITGGTGADVIIGGVLNLVGSVGTVVSAGNDTANYSTSIQGVNVDLETAQLITTNLLGLQLNLTLATVGSGGDAEGDILVGIKNLTGSGASDVLRGNNESNVLIGNQGNDYLDGSTGADSMEGGRGDDVYYTDNLNDVVTEAAGEGFDIIFADADYVLGDNAAIEQMFAEAKNGTRSIDLYGNDFSQYIRGNDGNNTIDGGAGSDTLVGRAGADHFQFTTDLGAGNIDHITDFKHGTDKIVLDNDVFEGLAAGGLSSAAFKDRSLSGVDNSDRILYYKDTGALFFDADGKGTQFTAVQFATIDNHAHLSAGDFLIVN